MSAGSPGPPDGALLATVASAAPSPRWAVVGAPLAALVAAGLAIGAAAAGSDALAAVLIVEQVGFAWAWVRALSASTGTILLVAAGGVIGDLVLLGSDRPHLGSVAGVIGVSVAAAVLYQLGRRRLATGPTGATGSPGSPGTPGPTASPGSAVRVTVDMAAALGGVTLAVLLAAYLALRLEPGAPHPSDLLVMAGLVGAGAAVVVGRLVGWARVPAAAAGVIGALAGVGAGAGIAAATSDRLPVGAALAMAAAGAVASAVVDLGLTRSRGAAVEAASSADPGTPAGPDQPDQLDRWERPDRPDQRDVTRSVADLLLGAVLPLAVAAPLVYVVGRHLPT